MTAPDMGHSAVGINPYSPTAVALVTELSEAPVTVPTAAVREAFAELDAYLRAEAPRQGRRQGGVITIVGEYGSGKTHLAAALWWRSSAGDPPAAHSMYLDAPADTFVRLYQRFMSQLNRYDVQEVLRDYYADVVAGDLAGISGTEEIMERLRSGEIDPVSVAHELQLMDSVLLQRLQESLISATGNAEIGTALTLLLDPAMELAVWDWLSGNRPSEYLQEKGLLQPIDTESTALSTIVAFAALFGQRQQRFVLVVDELDRVLAAVSQLGDEALGEFRRALTAFEMAGGFVVLVGQSDIQQTLGMEVLQRMGHIIKMPPMTLANVREYVSKSHEIARGDTNLYPFSDETLGYLTEITDGVPRQIIRLAHFLYAQAMEKGETVTVDMVRAVARNHFDIASVLDVRREVPQVLYREGIRFARGFLTDENGDLVVDTWVQRRDGDSACAVLITGSLLATSDIEDVKTRIAAARSEDEVFVVLIVVGYLSEQVKAALAEIGDLDYFVYYRRSFHAELAAAVAGALNRTGALDTVDDLPVIRERVERITRQESSLHGLIERLLTQVSASNEANERQLTALRREIADVSVRIPQAAADTEERPDTASMPGLLARTERVFAPALDAVADLHRIEDVLADAFNIEPEQDETTSDARLIVRRVLQGQDGLSPLGAAYFLGELVGAFRNAITTWYWNSDARTMGELSTSDRSRLDGLCYNYDAIFQYVPLVQLKRLAESSVRHSPYTQAIPGLGGPVTHLDDIRDEFESLSVRVRATVLEKSSDPPA